MSAEDSFVQNCTGAPRTEVLWGIMRLGAGRERSDHEPGCLIIVI